MTSFLGMQILLAFPFLRTQRLLRIGIAPLLLPSLQCFVDRNIQSLQSLLKLQFNSLVHLLQGSDCSRIRDPVISRTDVRCQRLLLPVRTLLQSPSRDLRILPGHIFSRDLVSPRVADAAQTSTPFPSSSRNTLISRQLPRRLSRRLSRQLSRQPVTASMFLAAIFSLVLTHELLDFSSGTEKTFLILQALFHLIFECIIHSSFLFLSSK